MVTTMDMHTLVGRRVAEARDRKGLSQAAVGWGMARLLGKAWSNKVVSFVETGQRQLDSSELLILAFVLDVPVYELLTPRTDEAVEFPSGEVFSAVAVTQQVVGEASGDPRLATVAGRIGALAAVADELARAARETATVLAGDAPDARRDIATVEVPPESGAAMTLVRELQKTGGEQALQEAEMSARAVAGKPRRRRTQIAESKTGKGKRKR